MAEFGQMAGGGFAGDENARHGYHDPRQGFETCGIAEYMLSFQILTRLSGSRSGWTAARSWRLTCCRPPTTREQKSHALCDFDEHRSDRQHAKRQRFPE